MGLREQEHNYEVMPADDGFKIIPIEKHRAPVEAHLLPSGFWVIKGEEVTERQKTMVYSNSGRNNRYVPVYVPGFDMPAAENTIYPLFSFSALLKEMVAVLYMTWDKIDKRVELEKQYEEFGHTFPLTPKYSEAARAGIIHQWAVKNTIKTLSKKASAIAKECHSMINSDIVKLHRLLYAEAGGSGYWDNIYDVLKEPEKSKYIIKDLINFKAARCFFLYTRRITEYPNFSSWDKFDWKNAVGDTKNAFVRKTISNYPKGVPYYTIGTLDAMREYGIQLEEPITSRIRLLSYYSICYMHDEMAKKFLKIIKKSTDDEIKIAVKMYANDYQMKPDLRRRSIINQALLFMFDYPMEENFSYNINIIGLYKRAKKYHEKLRDDMRREEAMKLAEKKELFEKEVQLPPIPLPDDKNISFLRTVKDLYDESNKMCNCVYSYADKAKKGYSYLFHVEYNGEQATAEVNSFGRVVQAKGPQNLLNAASEYAEKALAKWGKNFPSVAVTIDFKPSSVLEQAFADNDIPF